MNVLPANASDEEILGLAKRWAQLLAEERYDEAISLTRVAEDDTYTSADLKTLISNYGSYKPTRDGSVYRVTPLDSALPRSPTSPTLPLRPPCHEVDRLVSDYKRVKNPRYRGEVWFDLPLNGQWSDLTATFDIEAVEDGLVLVLNAVTVK